MNAVGREDAPFLVVMLHEPSEGMMNWWLKLVCQECGILKTDLRMVYLLNEPPKGSGGRPNKEQLRESWDRFKTEIEASKPRVVMPLGGLPLYYLTGIKETIFASRGYVIDKKYFRSIEVESYEQVGVYKTGNKSRGVTKGDPKYKWVTKANPGLLGDFDGVVIPSFDLNYVRLEGFTAKPAMKEDIRRAKRGLDGTLRTIDNDFKFYRTAAELGDWDFSTTSHVVAVDIETHGIDNEVIDLVSFSDGIVSASIPWNAEALDLMNKLFANAEKYGYLIAVHNSPFDIPRLAASGVVISEKVLRTRIFDTMFGAVTLQPNLLKGLGAAATVYLDVEPWKWRTLIDADPVFYSAKDAYVTAWLAQQEIKVMKSMGVWNLFVGDGSHPGPGIMATIPELTDMTRQGMRTNKPFAVWWTKKLERHQLRLEKLWARQFGNINPHSVKQVQELLYKTWGLPIQRNREGRISTDELALIRLRLYVTMAPDADKGGWRNDERCNQRVFDLLLRIRDISKTLSTYVQPVGLGDVTWVHPSYMPISKDDEAGKSNNMHSKGNTATGRLATYNPNIGNQPKKVRKLYVPDRDNFCFIQGDWKAAELVVLAHSSGDRRLLEDLKADMHQRNAERFGVTRKVAKNVRYASLYLAGPSKVSEMILKQEHLYVPADECARLMNGMSDYYTDLTAYIRHLIELCQTKHYIQNAFGRVRFFQATEGPAAVNFIPQSTTADCLWCILKPCADMARSYGGRLTTTVYDSILIQVPLECQAEAARELKTIMEQPFRNVAPDFYLPAEIEIGAPGASWKDLKVAA